MRITVVEMEEQCRSLLSVKQIDHLGGMVMAVVF